MILRSPQVMQSPVTRVLADNTISRRQTDRSQVELQVARSDETYRCVAAAIARCGWLGLSVESFPVLGLSLRARTGLEPDFPQTTLLTSICGVLPIDETR